MRNTEATAFHLHHHRPVRRQPCAATGLLMMALMVTQAQVPAQAQVRPQAVTPVTAGVQLDGPRGGWHASGVLEDENQPAVAYPYNLIDRGAQKNRTLITGRLQQARKALDAQTGTSAGSSASPSANASTSASATPRRPRAYALVVNGNTMPLYGGDDGRFVRPYAFGPGSNSIEVRNPDGRSERRVQFYETRGNGPKAALRVIASWDDNQAEIDMHVITPDGQHAFWANPALQGGGGLDVDSVDGAGPEMFSITAPIQGAYHLYVNYWGNFGDSGYHFDQTTRQKPVITVRLTVVQRENTPQEKRETVVVPLRRIGDLTWVKSLNW